MSVIDPQLEALLEIQKNTAPGPRPVFIQEQQEELIKKAGEVPLTLLLGIPTIFSGLLPLLFNYGSEMAGERLAAFVSTFFVTFFALPLMLLIFRSYGVGVERFAVYALLLASASYGISAWYDASVPSYVIIFIALVFGLGPQVAVSGWWRVLRVEARWMRRARSRNSDGLGSTERSGWIRIPRRWFVERRRTSRLPNPPLVAFSAILTCGIAALVWVPEFGGELRAVPFGQGRAETRDSVHRPPYSATVSLIPEVNAAKRRYERLIVLRDRDAETLPVFADHDTLWNAAVQMRFSVRDGSQGVVGALDTVSSRSVDALINAIEKRDGIWKARLDSLDDHWVAGLRAGGAVPGHDPLVSRAEASLRQARAAVHAGLDGNAGKQSRFILGKDDSLRIEKVQILEGVVALLRTGRAEQSARLLAVDDQLVGQEAAIFSSLNKFTQVELARIVNNVRVIGVWIFGSALLVALFGVWSSTRALRLHEKQLSNRSLWLREREARRKGTYVLGCAVLALFTLPLLKPIKPEKLDLSQPFTPFTLPTFYLPAFAGQQLQTPQWGASIENRAYGPTFRSPGEGDVTGPNSDPGVVSDLDLDSLDRRIDGTVRRALADSVRGPVTQMITQTETIVKEIQVVRSGVEKMRARADSVYPHIYQEAGN